MSAINLWCSSLEGWRTGWYYPARITPAQSMLVSVMDLLFVDCWCLETHLADPLEVILEIKHRRTPGTQPWEQKPFSFFLFFFMTSGMQMRSKVQLVCVSLSSRSLSSGEFTASCLRGPTDRNVSVMFTWINAVAALWHFHMSNRKEFFTALSWTLQIGILIRGIYIYQAVPLDHVCFTALEVRPTRE